MTDVHVEADVNLLVNNGTDDVPLLVHPEVLSPTGYVLPVSVITGGGGGGGTVALDAPTLAALEQVTVSVAAGQLIGLDAATLAALENIVVTGEMALDAATLAALESVNATVSGTVGLDSTTLAALETINAVVSGTVAVSNFPATQAVSGTVALDAPTLAALEQITVLIANGQVVGLDAATLAALESVTVAGTVALDSATLAALENISAVVSGTVALDGPTLSALESITALVSNFPAEYPLPAAQVATLTPQTNALTDTELRASPVPVTTGVPTIAEPVVGNTLSAGDLLVVAAPGVGQRIVVRYLYTLVDPDATTTPILHWKSSSGSYDLFRGFAISKTWTWSLPENEGLVLNLSASTDASGAVFTVFYAQEAI